MPKIINSKKGIKIGEGEDISSACESLGVPFSCYEGTCGICKINILKGEKNLSELTEREKDFGMDNQNRLACQCKIKKGDIEIDF